MSYLFDPANWEWVTTGNNVRFILEGFLINLQIALDLDGLRADRRAWRSRCCGCRACAS